MLSHSHTVYLSAMLLIFFNLLHLVSISCHALNLVPAQALSANIPSPLVLKVPNSSLPSSESLSSFSALATSSAIILTSRYTVVCDPEKYGNRINYDSCLDAYEQLPQFMSEVTFGPRTSGTWTVKLPWRVYSCKSSRRSTSADRGTLGTTLCSSTPVGFASSPIASLL